MLNQNKFKKVLHFETLVHWGEIECTLIDVKWRETKKDFFHLIFLESIVSPIFSASQFIKALNSN